MLFAVVANKLDLYSAERRLEKEKFNKFIVSYLINQCTSPRSPLRAVYRRETLGTRLGLEMSYPPSWYRKDYGHHE